MKIKTKENGPCRVALTVESDAEEVRPEYEKVLKQWVRRAQVPGFRVGKAPRNIVERHYRGKIVDNARDVLLQRLYRDALKKKEIEPVAILDLSDVEFAPGRGMKFTLTLDVPPEFKLPRYKGLTIKDEPIEVGDQQVDARIEEIRTLMAQFEDAEEGDTIARGDIAGIDYSATVDGKPLRELAGDCDKLAGAEDFWVQADEPEFIPGLALALVGMRAGETRDIEVTFPEDFHVEALRGRKSVYKVTVNSIRHKVLPEIDEEFLKKMNVERLEDFRKRLHDDLVRRAEQAREEHRRREVVTQLTKKCNFDLPASEVQEETRMTLRMMIDDVFRRGGTRETIEKNRDDLLKAASATSEERVRVHYILDRIAREENLAATDEEVEEHISRLAASNGQDAAEMRKRIEERHGLERVRSDLRAQKAMSLILAEAKYK